MAYPDGLVILQEELWHLADEDLRRLWGALSRARFSRAVAFREQVRLMGVIRLSGRALAPLCHAASLLAVLECLVHERLLSRRQCTQIEERLLRHIDRHGQWQGEQGGAARASCHAPDIVLLWEA